MANKRGKSPFFSDEEFLTGVQEVQEEKEAASEKTIPNESPTVIFGETQGRKGLKVPRINMGFSPENHAWVRLRSRQRGMTITEYVNALIDRDRAKK